MLPIVRSLQRKLFSMVDICSVKETPPGQTEDMSAYSAMPWLKV
ncbi:hypothetical protein MCEMSEM22_01623 [Comamonadaceae bacterium]